MLVSCLACSSAMKIKATRTSKTSVDFQRITALYSRRQNSSNVGFLLAHLEEPFNGIAIMQFISFLMTIVVMMVIVVMMISIIVMMITTIHTRSIHEF
jgi:predicted permease